MRFATWNLDWWQRNPERVPRQELLDQCNADVVALQEVRGSVARQLRSRHPGPSLFSQELHLGATWSWMGCGLLLRVGTTVLDSGVIATLPKPQRGLWALIAVAGRRLTVVSWHAPNIPGDGLATKMSAFEAMSQWISTAPAPVVLGADLNSWRDPIDPLAADPLDRFYQEHQFVGPDAPHGLRDVYRTVINADGRIDELRSLRPEGPLATSYVLSDGSQHRMDRIYALPELQPVGGDYDYESAVRCGSDHALHWIDFA